MAILRGRLKFVVQRAIDCNSENLCHRRVKVKRVGYFRKYLDEGMEGKGSYIPFFKN